MSRRKIEPIKKLSLLEIFNDVNEVFDSAIETKYTLIDYGEYFAYRFKTKSENEYDLEFHYSHERGNTKLDNNKLLNEYIKEVAGLVDCFDVSFTLTNVINKDNPDEFEIETNLHEQYDLMGRIAYIIKNEIKRNINIKLFIIGGDSRRNRLDIYKTIFNKQFNDVFDLFHGKSMWHKGDSLFIIRKK